MVNSHKGGVEKLAVPNVKVLARTCDRCSGIVCPTVEGRSCSFGDVEKALMWLYFQSGGSAVSVLPMLFIMPLGKSFVDVLE